MGARKRPQADEPEILLAPLRPAFSRARRGFDPLEVSAYLDMIEQERSDLGTALLLTQRKVREQQDGLARHQAVEDELTRSLHLAKQTADAILADAQQRASQIETETAQRVAAHEADGRRRLAEEERQLDGLRMALAAEAAGLVEVEAHLGTRISRAAAALVKVVDSPGGLGPFSQATATLLEFAEILQRATASGQSPRIRLDMETGAPVAVVTTVAAPPNSILSLDRPGAGLVGAANTDRSSH